MVRSYWKSCPGGDGRVRRFAWSQIPSSQTGAKERIMTVHEDGKTLRCRIINTWQLADGSTAYHVQSLETGEMITLVQRGRRGGAQPALNGQGRSTCASSTGATQHPPAGVPMSPSVSPASGQVVSLPGTPRSVTPLFGGKKSNATACPDCTERILMWEDGKPGQPIVSSSGSPSIVAASNQSTPTRMVASNQAGSASNMPVIVNQQPGVVCSDSAQGQVCQTRPNNASAPTIQSQDGPTSKDGVIIWQKRYDPVTKKEVQQMVPEPGKPQSTEVLWEKYTDPVTGKEVYSVPPKTGAQQHPASQPPRKFGERVFQPKQTDPVKVGRTQVDPGAAQNNAAEAGAPISKAVLHFGAHESNELRQAQCSTAQHRRLVPDPGPGQEHQSLRQ